MPKFQLARRAPHVGRCRPDRSKENMNKIEKKKSNRMFSSPLNPKNNVSTPIFPLKEPPLCIECGQACIRSNVKLGNINGGAGRKYWKCINKIHYKEKTCTQYEGLFHCYDDDEGIRPYHPRCKCGWPSRLVRGGWRKSKITDIYSCCIKRCDWVNYNSKTTTEVKRKSKLLASQTKRNSTASQRQSTLLFAARSSHYDKHWINLTERVVENFIQPNAAPSRIERSQIESRVSVS